ncbi:MAG: ATP-binding protein [Candidatus Hodarchaeales archaeon]
MFNLGFSFGNTGRTGLGLYIVKNIIERYGGKITVENNEPKGSKFIFKLRKPMINH